MTDSALLNLTRQQSPRPELRSYNEPWYRAMPNAVADWWYGENANAQQAEGLRTLLGTSNPLNIPGQAHEGVDTARGAYAAGDVKGVLGGLGQAALAVAPLPVGRGMMPRKAAVPHVEAPPVAAVPDARAPNSETAGIRSYHGSPHSFDRFDGSKIGTGEGTQLEGHGLYFSDLEANAKGYRDRQDYKVSDPVAAYFYNKHNGNTEQAIAALDAQLASQPDGLMASSMKLARNALETPSFNPASNPRGHMYEVNINAKPEQFLNYDTLPKARQQELSTPEGVAKAVSEGYVGHTFTGSDHYARPTNRVIYPGKEDLITILNKYGLAGLTAGGAATAGSVVPEARRAAARPADARE